MPQIKDRGSLYTFIVCLGTLISGMCVDIYSPSLPAVTRYFAVDKSLVQLSISIYVFAYGVAQLFAGSHSDSIGRKKPLIVATLMFTLVSFLISYSQSIYQLLELRFLQGVTVAYINVPIRAVIADLYKGKKFYKEMNYVSIAWSIGPVIAPVLGGYFQHYFGWQASFQFLTIYGGITFILCAILLPETIHSRKQFNARQILYNYWRILNNSDYFLGAFVLGLLYALLILFGVVAPFLIQDVLGYTPVTFGHIALLMGSMWFLGNVTNRFLQHVNMAYKVRFCLFAMSLISGIMLLIAIKTQVSIYNIIIPIPIIFYFGGLVFPNHFAYCVALFQQFAASAGALLGTVVVVLGGLGSIVGVVIKSHTEIPLATTYFGICLLALFASFMMKYRAPTG